MKQNKIHQIEIRYAIVYITREGAETIHATYADENNLKTGIKRMNKNKWKPYRWRVAKLRITTEEET